MECEDITNKQSYNQNNYYANNQTYQYNQMTEQYNMENAFSQMNLKENQTQQFFPFQQQNSNCDGKLDLTFGQNNSQNVVARKYKLRELPSRKNRNPKFGENVQQFGTNHEEMNDESYNIEECYNPGQKSEDSEGWEDEESSEGEEVPEMNQEHDQAIMNQNMANPQMMDQHLQNYMQYRQHNQFQSYN